MYTLSSRCLIERSFLHGNDRDLGLLRSGCGSSDRRRRVFKHQIEAKKCDLSDGGRGQNAKLSNSSRDSPHLDEQFEVVGSQFSENWIDDDEEEEAFDPSDNLGRFKGLVLDLTYRPINVVSWKRSLCLEILDKAEVLAYYDQIVCSPSRAFFIPAVLRMTQFVYAPKPRTVKLTLSKTNVFIRDRFKCQYCERQEDLTIDHVLPLSKGGRNTWDNLVTACRYCNAKKGNRTIEDAQMKLSSQPKEPRASDNRELPPSYRVFKALVCNETVPTEWADYLPEQRPKKGYRWRK